MRVRPSAGVRAGPGLVAALLIVASPARADDAHERLRLARDAADVRYQEAQRVCASRFVVSSCVERALAEHRAEVARLRSEELRLDDAARRAAADAKTRQIEAKRTQADRSAAAPTASAAADASGRGPSGGEPRLEASTPETTAASGASAASRRPAGRLFPAPSSLPRPAGPTGAARGERERENEARYASRAAEAEAHRAEVVKRNAERAARGKAAAPLPMPGASSR